MSGTGDVSDARRDRHVDRAARGGLVPAGGSWVEDRPDRLVRAALPVVVEDDAFWSATALGVGDELADEVRDTTTVGARTAGAATAGGQLEDEEGDRRAAG